MEPESPTPPGRHRREFLGLGLALGASAVALGAGADDPKAKDEPTPKPDAPKPTTEADARMELVLARFGPQLDGPARQAVRREIEMITRRAEGLRKFALDNGDGPFPVFHPYRAPLA